MSTDISAIEINPNLSAQASVIWLHGLGADGNDFVPIVKELNLSDSLPLRFVFPHAPMRPITINQGYVMRAWFDVPTLKFDEKIDQKGIFDSMKIIQDLIENEKQLGFSSKKIILAGFSQGAVMALTTGLTYPQRLGGILALSGCLPFTPSLTEKIHQSNHDTPIFLAHGIEDNIVPYTLGASTHLMLKKYHYPVDWHSYNMGHSLCSEEVKDIRNWFKQVIT